MRRRRVAGVGEPDLQGRHAFGVDDPVGAGERQQAARHQAGPGEQDQGQGQLGRHEPSHPAPGRPAGGPRRAGRGGEIANVRPRRVQRRRQPEDQGGRQAGRGEERQHAAVDGEIDPEGRHQRLDAHGEQPRAQVGEAQAEHPCGARDHHALGQKLPHDARARRPQRHAHADLAGTARVARQQQAGGVGAGDEQHDDRGDEQRRQSGPQRPVVVLVERVDPRPESRVGVGVGGGEARRDGVEVRLGPRDGHAVGEASHGPEDPPVARLPGQVGREPQRLPQLRPHGELEALGHDADDRRRRAVDADDAADHLGVGAVAARPHAVPEHHDGGRAGPVVLGPKVAAEQRLDAEETERVRGDARARDPLGRQLGVAHRHRRLGVGGDAAEAGRLGPPVPVVEVRQPPLAAVGVAHRQRHDAVLVVDGQASDEHGVVHREPRAREPDAEPEGEHRRRREPAFLEQQPHREPQVVPRLVDPPRAARVAAHLLDGVEAAELEARAAARLLLRQAGPDVLGDLTLDVVAQLGVQLVLDPLAMPQPSPPAHDGHSLRSTVIGSSRTARRTGPRLAISPTRVTTAGPGANNISRARSPSAPPAFPPGSNVAQA